MEKKEKSEFGRGLLICLAKFRSHFENKQFQSIARYNMYLEKIKEEREEMLLVSCRPELNYGEDVRKDVKYFEDFTRDMFDGDYKKSMSYHIKMFMNGASDHLYEIKFSKYIDIGAEIIFKINNLKHKALGIGHGNGFIDSDVIYTFEELKKLFEETDEILVAIDRKLGIDDADIGEY